MFHLFADVAINVDVRAENLTLPNRTGGDSFVAGDDVVLNCSATNPHGVDRDLTIRWFRLATQGKRRGCISHLIVPPQTRGSRLEMATWHSYFLTYGTTQMLKQKGVQQAAQ